MGYPNGWIVAIEQCILVVLAFAVKLTARTSGPPERGDADCIAIDIYLSAAAAWLVGVQDCATIAACR